MSDPNVAQVMTGWTLMRSLLRSWFIRNVSRRVPRIVWIGQEIDVLVTFTEDRLRPVAFDPNNPKSVQRSMAQLFEGALPKIEAGLREIGVEFDRGVGLSGHDWEWDWSLRGPVRVKFRGVCKTAERRQ